MRRIMRTMVAGVLLASLIGGVTAEAQARPRKKKKQPVVEPLIAHGKVVNPPEIIVRKTPKTTVKPRVDEPVISKPPKIALPPPKRKAIPVW